MPSAEIITIGTEILLGEIVDTNSQFIARSFRDIGIDLYRKTTVGDNAARISQAIQQSLNRCKIVITTGGLGPTVDDPTREAVARAMGVETEFRPELWEQIRERFKRFGHTPTENNKRQAYIPLGAISIENPVGTAPCFIFERTDSSVISLPGVPREMEHLMQYNVLPYLRSHYGLSGTIKARVLHTAGAGESQIDDLIADLEILNNPTVGLSAHSGQVDVRITAKAESEEAADELIHNVEIELRRRLAEWVYGADEDTLEIAALRNVQRKGWNIVVLESGLGGNLTRVLAEAGKGFLGGEVLIDLPSREELFDLTTAHRKSRGADVGLGVALYPGQEKQDVHIVLVTPNGDERYSRPYGGPPGNAPRWALHHSLNVIRSL